MHFMGEMKLPFKYFCCCYWCLSNLSSTENKKYFCFFKNKKASPDRCGSVGWVLSHKAKGHQFDSHSGHMPGLWGLVGAPVRGNRSMFLLHTSVFLFLPFSLPSSPFKVNK